MARRVAFVSRAVRYCSSTTSAPSVSASDESVQQLLLRITGQDFERLYAARKQDLNLPQYRLLSEEQLREVSCMRVLSILCDCYTRTGS